MNRVVLAVIAAACLFGAGCDGPKAYVFTVDPAPGFAPADGADLLKEVETALPRAKFERQIITRPNRKVLWIVTEVPEARERIEAALKAAPKLKISRIDQIDADAVKDYVKDR
jgi:hypothetical protein